ncbi:MAG: TetR/AcrR family transcriptional regulator, partial [Pseudomonadota bacterium]
KELADTANVPVASVYHFFPVPEAALAALVEHYIEKAAIEIMSNLEPAEGSNWQGIVNEVFARGRFFYEKYPAARKVGFCPHSSESARYLLLESNWTLAEQISSEFDRLFVLPPHLNIVDDVATAIILTDALWSTSIALHGEITDHYAAEAERAVASFLFPVLGAELPEK